MTVALLVACSALFLENQDFIILEVLQDLALNRGAFYNRCADFNLTVVVCEQTLSKLTDAFSSPGRRWTYSFRPFSALNC